MKQKQRRSMGAAVLVILLMAALWMQWRQNLESSQDAAEATAQQYIRQAIPSVSRGSRNTAKGDGEEGKEEISEKAKGTAGEAAAQEEARDSFVLAAAKALTDLSLPVVAVNGRALPPDQGQAGSGTAEPEPVQTAQTPEEGTADKGGSEAKEGEGENGTGSDSPEKPAVTDSVKKPAVLIYHTHATESYQPVSEGNFHSVEKEGTVRQVGDMLAQRLEELGYQVIHDETVHDNPSYNQSYSRSLETARGYLDQYPDLALVVDLHRDAAGYAGGTGKTVTVEGKNAASYGYVIGQGNPNVAQLTETVNDLNRAAEKLYPGFTGRIIEKAYKFNQYISDHHVLIEVGNNENTIEQAKLTGRYLGDVIAAYLKERGV